MAFGLPFYAKKSKLYVKCMVNNETNATDWMYLMPDKSFPAKLPECNYLCEKDPIDDPTTYNRTWIVGTLTVGTKARYTCLSMKTNLLYH